MKIYIKVKNVYGCTRIYPDCEASRLLLGLTGRKCFTQDDCYTLFKLGYDVIERSNQLQMEG